MVTPLGPCVTTVWAEIGNCASAPVGFPAHSTDTTYGSLALAREEGQAGLWVPEPSTGRGGPQSRPQLSFPRRRSGRDPFS